ncbi:MAG: 50S ribosomal protein L32e [Nanoarchaeota archaeon]
MEHKKLLELRNKRKKSKPKFVVHESKIYARMKSKWKFPYGTSSSVRLRHRGSQVMVSVGFGSPKEVRGLHSSGLEKVVVHNREELLKVDVKTQGAVISSQVGQKKRAELLQLAVEKKIRVLNFKDVSRSLNQIKEEMADRQKIRKEKLTTKSKKQEEKKKKAEEKKNKEEAEKKKAEKDKNGNEEAPEGAEPQQEEREIIEKELTKRQ